MVDLPKIKTELTGDISDLARAFAEASALRNAWIREQNDALEKGGKEGGVKMAKGWRDSFERELKGQPPKLFDDKFGRDLDAMFKRMGVSSGEKFFGEFDKLFGGTGQSGRFVGAFDRWGVNMSQTFRNSFFKDMGNLFSPSSWEKAFSGLGADGKKLGFNFAGGFWKGVLSFFDNPVTIGIGIPVIGTILAGVLAGVGGLGGTALGLTGLAAGIIGQLKDPRIKAVATQTGHDMFQALTDSSTSFAGPLEVALRRYDSFVQTSTGKFSQVYQPLAALLVPLERGFESFTDKVLPGLIDGANRAGPLVQTFAKELPEIGKAVSDFFEKLTNSERGNREGLISIIDLVDELIRFLGNLIEVGSHAYAGMISVGHAVAPFVDGIMGGLLRLEGKIPIIGMPFKFLGDAIHRAREEVDKLYNSGGVVPGAQAAIDAVSNVTKAIKDQSKALDDVMSRWDKWFGVSMGVDQANLTLHQDILALTDSLTQNGRQWDLNTKAGQANYSALLQAIQAAHDYRQAQIDAGTSTAEANKTYQDNIDKLLAQAGAGGLDAGSIQNLRNQVGSLADSLASLNGSHVTYFVDGYYANNNQFYKGDPANFRGGLEFGGVVPEAVAAQGIVVGPRRPGTMVLMGEPGTRGEVAIPMAGISRQRAAALGATALAPHGLRVSPAGDGGGSDALHLSVTVPVTLNGRQIAVGTYEDFVNVGQERKNRKGTTGF